MIRIVRDFRLIPLVLIATTCLFVLKTFGLVFDGGYLFRDIGTAADESDITGTVSTPKKSDAVVADDAQIPSTIEPATAPKAGHKRSWAQEMFNYPDVTGSTGESKKEEPAKPAAKEGEADAKAKPKPKDPPPNAGWTPVAVDAGAMPTSAERAILERLGDRRKELDARAKALDLRENLMTAAEKRVEARVAELKALEVRVDAAAQIKDESEASRFKNVVTMYENMKAKDAAKIFDRLDMKVLVDVATKINPRRMSDILAQMSPDTAERLTMELTSRKEKTETEDLPKIEGHPTAN